jgi:hypothetical protein
MKQAARRLTFNSIHGVISQKIEFLSFQTSCTATESNLNFANNLFHSLLAFQAPNLAYLSRRLSLLKESVQARGAM